MKARSNWRAGKKLIEQFRLAGGSEHGAPRATSGIESLDLSGKEFDRNVDEAFVQESAGSVPVNRILAALRSVASDGKQHVDATPDDFPRSLLGMIRRQTTV